LLLPMTAAAAAAAHELLTSSSSSSSARCQLRTTCCYYCCCGCCGAFSSVVGMSLLLFVFCLSLLLWCFLCCGWGPSYSSSFAALFCRGDFSVAVGMSLFTFRPLPLPCVVVLSHQWWGCSLSLFVFCPSLFCCGDSSVVVGMSLVVVVFCLPLLLWCFPCCGGGPFYSPSFASLFCLWCPLCFAYGPMK